MPTSAMRLARCTVKMSGYPGRAILGQAAVSRSFHAGAAMQASKRGRTKASIGSSSSASRAAPSAGASAAPKSAISEKIQVLPFNMMPSVGTNHAMAVAMQAVGRLRGGTGFFMRFWSFYQELCFRLRLPHKSMIPYIVRWQAIYLPVWRLDSIISLDERVSGIEYNTEISTFGADIPATQTEPLASVPLQLRDTLSYAEDAEPYSPHKHLYPFRTDDMNPGEEVKTPVLIPFSLIPPKMEDVYRKIASAYRSEEVRFPGEVRSILQAAYPLLVPFYLVEVADANPAYSHEPATTCLLMGRKFPNPVQIVANAYRDGAWLEGESKLPDTNLTMVMTSRFDEANPDGSTFNSLTQHRGVDAVFHLFPEIWKSIREDARLLDANTKLSEFSKEIESIDWMQNYTACAEANESYSIARLDVRKGEQSLKHAKDLAEMFQQRLDELEATAPDAGQSKLVDSVESKFVDTARSRIAPLKELVKQAQAKLDDARKYLQEVTPPWLRS